MSTAASTRTISNPKVKVLLVKSSHDLTGKPTTGARVGHGEPVYAGRGGDVGVVGEV